MAERAKRASRLYRGHEGTRPNAHQRGYDRRWRAARRRFLGEHPYCRFCERAGRSIAATVVDHITPHRGREAVFWDSANWQPLCKRCHDAKTRGESSC